MPKTVFLFGNASELKEELVLTTSFAWVALRRGEVLKDYVRIDHEPVLVKDRLKGVDDAEFLLLCMSDLFNAAGVDRAEVTLEKFREHPEAEVAFDNYLLDLVLFSDKSELFKVRFAVATPKATASEKEQISVQVRDYRVAKLITAASGGVNSHYNPGVFKKLIPYLGRFVEKITMKTD
jgi:hypothetical protein